MLTGMVAVLLACVYIQGAFCFLLQFGESRGFEPPSMPARLALSAVGVLVYVITHEAGHRVAGAALGWRCIRCGFGPFEFYRERDVWKSQRVKMLLGAFVRQVPPSFTGFRRAKTVTLLSGPLSSLVFGLLFGTVALSTASPSVYAIFGTLALWSLLGVLELIPREKNGIGSDGYRLWQVIRGGAPIDDMIRESMAEASNFTMLRHRDWPHALVVRLAATEDPYGIYLAYLHTLDAGDPEAASGYMRSLIASLPEEKPNPHFACEAAYWLATYAGNPKASRTWLERAGQDVDPDLRFRAQAALALAEGQPDRAEALANESLARIHTLAPCGSGEFEIDRLNHLLSLVGQPILAAAGFQPALVPMR
jgi:hypothetical protein